MDAFSSMPSAASSTYVSFDAPSSVAATTTAAELFKPESMYRFQDPMGGHYRSTNAHAAAAATSSHVNRPELAFVSPPAISSHGGRRSYYDDSFLDPNPERSSPEAPSIERGHQLLCFSSTGCSSAVLDLTGRPSTATVSAQLHGMFFLAESSRTGTGELVSSPPELTCYRRNLFQVTGTVTLPRMMQCAMNAQGERVRIESQELTVSATESVEGSPVKIISVPWKTPAASGAASGPSSAATSPQQQHQQPQQAQAQPEDKSEKEPSSIPLDQSASHDVDSEFSVYPIAWKRLQFRVATANNGRRKELQQHFTLKLSVVATLADGSKISLCEALSGPIVVRGRSPRNFQTRRDVPLSGSGISMRRSTTSSVASSVSPLLKRSITVDSLHRDSLAKSESAAAAAAAAIAAGPPGDMGFSVSPTDSTLRRHSPPSSSLEWHQAGQSVTAPVSPYMQSSAEMRLSSTTGGTGLPLKRKAEAAGLRLPLAIPQGQPFNQRSSAPPPDRPHKMQRPRCSTFMNGVNATGPPMFSDHHLSSLPANTFSFPSAAATTGTTSFFVPGMSKTAGTDSMEPIGNYFPAMEEWMPSTENIYRPHLLQTTIP